MCAGDCDGRFIIFHQLPQQFGAGQHGDLLCNSLNQLCIVPADGGGIDYTVDAVNDIGGLLAVKNLCPAVLKLLRERGGRAVRAGDGKTIL